MIRSSLLLSLSVLLLVCVSVASAVRLPAIFGHGMVLQASHSTIWGVSTPRTAVSLRSSGFSLTTISDYDGKFIFTLPVLEASPRPYNINITDTSSTVTLNDVLFGDVYLCSGQSNMQLAVNQIYNGNVEIADSINYPLIRIYSVVRINSSVPLNDTKSYTPPWLPAGPISVAPFSAACYFAARDTYITLNGTRPIGLVGSDWGGTIVEDWTSAQTLNSTCGPMQPYPTHDANPEIGVVLYNGMIAPIIQMQFTGVLWYQGEQNSYNATSYACRFPAMIEDWRARFKQDLPFFFVLLAPILGETTFVDLRFAQLKALALPRVFVANPLDSGDKFSPLGSVHSRAKQPVGVRLSLLMRRFLYQQRVVAEGPQHDTITWPTSTSGTAVTTLEYDKNREINDGLMLSSTLNCTACCDDVAAGGSPFQARLSDGAVKWGAVKVTPYNVQVAVDVGSTGLTVIGLSLNTVGYPECVLKNTYGLLQLPFNLTRMSIAQHNKRPIFKTSTY